MITEHHAGTVTWTDVVDPTADELTNLIATYGLGDRTFDEAHRRAARPMMRRYDDHAYIVAFSGNLAEIDMYLGSEWFITVRRHDEEGHEWDRSEALHRFGRMPAGAGPGMALAIVLEDLVDEYFDTTDALEDQLEEIEDRIFGESLQTERLVQQDLFAVRRRLMQLRRAVMPLREVLSALLRQEVPWVDGEALVVLHDTFDKLLRAVDLVDELRELVGNAVEAHLAVISNQMNSVMKQLTAWGSIVFGATLIAGIYGMNFRHMPELDWYWGYAFALGLMAVMSFVLYRVFKRRDWL
jgi:magnesium transporter